MRSTKTGFGAKIPNQFNAEGRLQPGEESEDDEGEEDEDDDGIDVDEEEEEGDDQSDHNF